MKTKPKPYHAWNGMGENTSVNLKLVLTIKDKRITCSKSSRTNGNLKSKVLINCSFHLKIRRRLRWNYTTWVISECVLFPCKLILDIFFKGERNDWIFNLGWNIPLVFGCAQWSFIKWLQTAMDELWDKRVKRKKRKVTTNTGSMDFAVLSLCGLFESVCGHLTGFPTRNVDSNFTQKPWPRCRVMTPWALEGLFSNPSMLTAG